MSFRASGCERRDQQDPAARERSFPERLGMSVDQQWNWRENQALGRRLSRIDVLVIDDWAMSPLSEPEHCDFWEICEDRYRVRSTILTSQLPVSRWYAQIGDPTPADGTLDRLVHNAHHIEMRGDSMRKSRGKATAWSAYVKRDSLPVSIVSGLRSHVCV
jgi:IstB-like ATP binding protein